MILSLGNTTLELSGEIDIATADGIAAALGRQIAAGGPVVIDVSDVTFMDSTGLHLFIALSKALEGRGHVIVYGANGPVLKVLDMVGMLNGEAPVNMHVVGSELSNSKLRV